MTYSRTNFLIYSSYIYIYNMMTNLSQNYSFYFCIPKTNLT